MIFADNKFVLLCDSPDSELWISEDNGTTWNSVSIAEAVTSIYSVKDTLYVIESGTNVYQYVSDSLILCDHTDYEDVTHIVNIDSYWLAIVSDTSGYYLGISNNGINWSTNSALVASGGYLEQAGENVTSKVAAIVGGNSGEMIGDEIEVSAVIADTISVNNTPTEDNHVVSKKYLEEYVENALLNGTW